MIEKNTSDICNEKQFNAVFTEHSRELFNFMYYKTGDIDKAEDLVQDSFLKLWQNCKNVIFEKVKTFLYTIANNLFLDNIKHEKIVLQHRVLIEEELDNENPEYKLEEKEFKERIEIALARLSEKQRVVFLMNRIDKLTYKEIAERLEISVKAVEKRMHNALLQLNSEIFSKR